MPIKFKKDGVEFIRGERGTKPQQVVKKYFIKNTPKQELIDYANSTNSKPKIRIKCLNELTRRGVRLRHYAGVLSHA
jgi:hypothetical protein